MRSISNHANKNIDTKKHLCQYSIIEPLYKASPISIEADAPTSISNYYTYENALLTQILLNESVINKTVFEAAGFTVDCQIAGLGEIADIQALYIAHTQAAIDALNA